MPMLIYRFKITCEESDGFLREIEIQPGQTFLDFHHIIVESSELIQCDQASFFITDKKYKKDKEISLKPAKRQVRRYDEDVDQVVTEMVSVPVMKTEKIKDYIEDPHQKMIYEFKGKQSLSFFIELFKIFQSDGSVSFPRCFKKAGELPKPVEQPAPIPSKPVQPRPVLPRVPLPPIPVASRLETVVENDEELSAIESELEELLLEADKVDIGDLGLEESPEFEFSMEQDEDGESVEPLENIDDFEDLDNLDRRLSGYDRDQDDY
jgi:hypothetical protein